MDCTQAQDMLVELVYGELPPAGAADVEKHLAGCPACRIQAEKLKQARRLLSAYRANEPAGGTGLPAAITGGAQLAPAKTAPAGRSRVFRAVFAALAAAAMIVMAVLVYFLFEKTPTQSVALAQPVEIKRQNVSLTIMSEPDNLPVPYYRAKQSDEGYAVNKAAQMAEMAPFRYGWTGLALVRDTRLIANLAQGKTRVSLTDVPTQIIPESVRLRTVDDGDKLTIMEQNYQYDLASAWALLHKYIDQKISVSFKSVGGKAIETVAGKLLSFDDAGLVIAPEKADAGAVRTITRQQVQSIVMARMPDGLLTKPTLVWQLDNKAAQKQQQFEVAYMTHGLSWRADYVLKFHPAPAGGAAKPTSVAGVSPASSGTASAPAVIDTADIIGYATINNASGVTFENANLKLMAGDVHLVADETEDSGILVTAGELWADKKKDEKEAFAEKSFFEYHLYTLGRQTTIKDAETKQIQMVTGGGLKLTRGYVFDPTINATSVRVVSEFKNSKENGLGKPLPKGVVHLWAPDPDGQDTFIAKLKIDHTPVDEKVRLPWGFAFDIVGEFKQIAAKPNDSATWQYQIRNHKNTPITVTLIAHVPQTTTSANLLNKDGKEMPWHVRQVGWVEFDVTVGANAQTTVNFSFKYNNKNGGGLVSPYDKDSGPEAAVLETIPEDFNGLDE